jgi:type I restriction enzyme S subunit
MDRNRLYWEDFKRMPSCYPPPLEQMEIADAIEDACCRIDEGIHRVRQEIALLRELRNRLIADVVTGKLDVREVAAGLPDGREESEPVDEAEDESPAEEPAEDLDAIPEEAEA